MTRDKVSDHPDWEKYRYTKNNTKNGGVSNEYTNGVTAHSENNMSDGFGKSTEHLTASGDHHVATVSGGVSYGTTIDDRNHNEKTEKYQVYKWRWYVLATLAVLNFTNAMAWICFAAVTNFTADYYNVTVDDVNWLSLIYLVVTVPIGFVASWALDTLGLRATMLFGGWINLIGLIVRYLSTLPAVPDSGRYAVVMTGQGLAAFAQPFLLFAPTKLAATWFPENQRVIANSLGSMSNPLGILCSFLLSAGLVEGPEDIPFMLWVYIIPGGVACAMVTFGICSAEPPTPPSASAASDHESFFQGLKKCVRNLPYMILFLCFGGGYALFNAFSTFLEQIVCPNGYDDDFAGLLGGLMIACGILGAIISGLYVDKTGHFTPVVKVAFAMATLFSIVFVVCAIFPKLGIGLAIGAVGFGFFGFAMFPIALELGVECTYPVAEGTSAGFLQISGQLQGIILIIIGQFTAPLIPIEDAPEQQCKNATDVMDGEELTIPDMSIPLYIFAGYAVVCCVILLIFFKTDYKRVSAEERRQDAITETTQF